MVIQIPEELKKEFVLLLNVTQALYTEEEIERDFTENERRVLALLDQFLLEHLGPDKFPRYRTREDQARAIRHRHGVSDDMLN